MKCSRLRSPEPSRVWSRSVIGLPRLAPNSSIASRQILHVTRIAVDPFVGASDHHRNANFERIANPQKRRHGNRATSFDLLPMASGESEGNHILLAVAAPLAEFLDSLAKSFEEFGVIYHGASFTFA